MSQDSSSISEEERSLFRPFTRESLAAIETRIAEEVAKLKELEKKRAEGEVSSHRGRDLFYSFNLVKEIGMRGRYDSVVIVTIVFSL